MVERPTAGEALDELQRLALPEELGEYLPGLGDVVSVLRAQIAEAMIQKAKDNGDFDPNPPTVYGGGPKPPAPPAAPTRPPAPARPVAFTSGDVNFVSGPQPGSLTRAQMEKLLRMARRKRGSGHDTMEDMTEEEAAAEVATIDAMHQEAVEAIKKLKERREELLPRADHSLRKVAAMLHADTCPEGHYQGSRCAWSSEGHGRWGLDHHKQWLERARARVKSSGMTPREFARALRTVSTPAARRAADAETGGAETGGKK